LEVGRTNGSIAIALVPTGTGRHARRIETFAGMAQPEREFAPGALRIAGVESMAVTKQQFIIQFDVPILEVGVPFEEPAKPDGAFVGNHVTLGTRTSILK
jgi:hypothetical protein